MSTVAPAPAAGSLAGLKRWSLVAGVVALAACAVGGVFNPHQFFRAYLAAFAFVVGLGLGSMVILMVYHLTDGAWGYLLRRTLEAAARTLPLLALMFVPIACGLSYLYLWARPEVVAGNPNLRGKEVYLNVPFFLIRAAVYFVSWSLLAFLLSRWSWQQDRRDDPAIARRLRRLSGPGLVFYGVAITFASVDWIMSLQPTFRSTIFGPLVASNQMLAAFCVVVLVVLSLAPRPPLSEAFSASVCNDLGNLLLTFLVVWAYLAFFQYLLVWIANIRYEAIWYLPRERNGWQWVALVLVVLGLVVPFFALLLKDVKRDPQALAAVAGLVLVMQMLFSYYQVLPSFPEVPVWWHGMDVLALVGLGGLWLACFLWQLGRAPLLPLHDASRASAVELRELDREEEVGEEEDEEAWREGAVHA